MASFANESGSFLNTGGSPVQVSVPASGNTVQLRRGESFYINPAATLAALTLTLPAAERGQTVSIGFGKAITALTIRNRLGAIVGLAPTAATANQCIVMKYVDKTIGWVPWA